MPVIKNYNSNLYNYPPLPQSLNPENSEEQSTDSGFSIDNLPREIILQIFTYLQDLTNLPNICLVNRRWKEIGSNISLWKSAIYNDLAFTPKKWKRCFGDNVVKIQDDTTGPKSLPDNIVEEYKIFQTYLNKQPNLKNLPSTAKNALILTWIPAKIFQEPINLKNFGQLLKTAEIHGEKPFENSPKGYHNTAIGISLRNTYPSINRWVLMTTNVLPGSIEQSYDTQEKMIQAITQDSNKQYEMLNELYAIVSIMTRFLDCPNTKIAYNDSYTRTTLIFTEFLPQPSGRSYYRKRAGLIVSGRNLLDPEPGEEGLLLESQDLHATKISDVFTKSIGAGAMRVFGDDTLTG